MNTVRRMTILAVAFVLLACQSQDDMDRETAAPAFRPHPRCPDNPVLTIPGKGRLRSARGPAGQRTYRFTGSAAAWLPQARSRAPLPIPAARGGPLRAWVVSSPPGLLFCGQPWSRALAADQAFARHRGERHHHRHPARTAANSASPSVRVRVEILLIHHRQLYIGPSRCAVPGLFLSQSMPGSRLGFAEAESFSSTSRYAAREDVDPTPNRHRPEAELQDRRLPLHQRQGCVL